MIAFFGRYFFALLLLAGSLSGKTAVFFSPDDNPRQALVSLINATREHLHAAVYLITDHEITQALIAAKKRGVEVEIIADVSCEHMHVGKLSKLRQNDIPVHVYDPPEEIEKKKRGIMHDKFAVFDGQVLWTGSFNWTFSASVYNQENALVIEDEPAVIARYVSQFEVLKSRCHDYEKRGIPAMERQTLSETIQCALEELWSSVAHLFVRKAPTKVEIDEVEHAI